MKKIFLSTALLAATLLSVQFVAAQKISNPDQKTVRLSDTQLPAASYSVCVDYCRVTGCGNASSVTAQLVAEGTFTSSCKNGGNDTGPIPGQTLKVTGPSQTFSATNGNIIIQNLCATVTGGCKSQGGSGWTSTISDVNITNLYMLINGAQVSLNNFLSQLSQ